MERTRGLFVYSAPGLVGPAIEEAEERLSAITAAVEEVAHDDHVVVDLSDLLGEPCLGVSFTVAESASAAAAQLRSQGFRVVEDREVRALARSEQGDADGMEDEE